MSDQSWWDKIPPPPDKLPPFRYHANIVDEVIEFAVEVINWLNPLHKGGS